MEYLIIISPILGYGDVFMIPFPKREDIRVGMVDNANSIYMVLGYLLRINDVFTSI